MRLSQIRYVTCLLVVACANQTPPNDPPSGSGARVTPSARGAYEVQPDTAFIEIRRIAHHGSRTAEGGCRWSQSVPDSPRIPASSRFEERPVSFDRSTCLNIVALGYRRVWPAEDTVGYESRSASTFMDSAAIAARHRTP
jgi:hypothetical protein